MKKIKNGFCMACTGLPNISNGSFDLRNNFGNLRLSELSSKTICKVVDIYADPQLRRRLFELGFVENATVQIINISPMSCAYLLLVQNSLICIRTNILDHIYVKLV